LGRQRLDNRRELCHFVPSFRVNMGSDFMNSPEEIRQCIGPAASRAAELDELYAKLPATNCLCDSPGVCCTFLPEMTALEAFRWLERIYDLGPVSGTDMVKRFVEFYLTSLVRLSRCPFVDEGRCSAYDIRTFACRAYGLWSRKLGEERTGKSRRDKEAFRLMWKKFGLDVPKDVIEFEIDYCTDVTHDPAAKVTDARLMKLLEKVYVLSRSMGDLQDRFERDYHSDFSFLVSSLALGKREALMAKMLITKEVLDAGTDHNLRKTLEMISPDKLGMGVNEGAP
jgi:Fe-S-cluster containining protein